MFFRLLGEWECLYKRKKEFSQVFRMARDFEKRGLIHDHDHDHDRDHDRDESGTQIRV